MKIFLLAACCFIISVCAQAQQDPLYAQYFNNPMLINPACAGSLDRLFAGVAYRTQWSGIDGGPTTFNFNSHIALADNKVGAGVIVMQDKIGEYTNTQYGGTFAYKIKLENTVFSFGMQAGFVQYATNGDAIQALNPDPLFTPFSKTKFNTGAGVLVTSNRYGIGLSVPHMLSNKINQGDAEVQLYSQNYYLFGSYRISVTDRIDFKPSTLVRLTKDSPLSTDVNANITYNRLYTGGLFTRNFNTYGVLLQFVYKNARLSYVYELPGKSSALRFNTHEIGVAFSLDILQAHNGTDHGL